ncbi:hypothetical protein BC629DRAFT_1437164 [Irpex lacteus]|nr:hypothetical protein BC629DRAFT_1437164 [Irpex lacteus]
MLDSCNIDLQIKYDTNYTLSQVLIASIGAYYKRIGKLQAKEIDDVMHRSLKEGQRVMSVCSGRWVRKTVEFSTRARTQMRTTKRRSIRAGNHALVFLAHTVPSTHINSRSSSFSLISFKSLAKTLDSRQGRYCCKGSNALGTRETYTSSRSLIAPPSSNPYRGQEESARRGRLCLCNALFTCYASRISAETKHQQKVREALLKREEELRAMVVKHEAEVAERMARREEEIMEAVRKREEEIGRMWSEWERETREGMCRAVEERMEWVRVRSEELEREREEVEGMRGEVGLPTSMSASTSVAAMKRVGSKTNVKTKTAKERERETQRERERERETAHRQHQGSTTATAALGGGAAAAAAAAYDLSDEENLPSPFLKRVDLDRLTRTASVPASSSRSMENLRSEMGGGGAGLGRRKSGTLRAQAVVNAANAVGGGDRVRVRGQLGGGWVWAGGRRVLVLFIWVWEEEEV